MGGVGVSLQGKKNVLLLENQAAETQVSTTGKGNLEIMSSAFTVQRQFSAVHRTGSSWGTWFCEKLAGQWVHKRWVGERIAPTSSHSGLEKVTSLPLHHGWTVTYQLQYPEKSRKDRASVRDCGPLRMMLSEAATAIQPSHENGAHRGNLDSNKILQLNSNKIQIWREKQNEYRAKKRVEEKNTPTKAKQHLLMSRACILSNMKQWLLWAR